MTLYEECADVWQKNLLVHVDSDRDDPHFMGEARKNALLAVHRYIHASHPNTPWRPCETCGGNSPVDSINYDSGLSCEVCLVCGFGVDPG